MLLGNYPLTWVAHPHLLLVCCAAALLTIAISRFVPALRLVFLLLDALGLVVFTIIGCSIGLELGLQPVMVVVAGLITGVAGGIMRDVLCNDVPLIFSTELYATVSMVTGVLFLLGLNFGVASDILVAGVLLLGFALRCVAILFKLEIPKFFYDKSDR